MLCGNRLGDCALPPRLGVRVHTAPSACRDGAAEIVRSRYAVGSLASSLRPEATNKQADHADLTDEWILDKLMLEVQTAESDGARASSLKTLAQTRAMLTMKHKDETQQQDDTQLALSLAGMGMVNPPVSTDDLNESDRELYDTLMSKLGH